VSNKRVAIYWMDNSKLYSKLFDGWHDAIEYLKVRWPTGYIVCKRKTEKVLYDDTIQTERVYGIYNGHNMRVGSMVFTTEHNEYIMKHHIASMK